LRLARCRRLRFPPDRPIKSQTLTVPAVQIHDSQNVLLNLKTLSLAACFGGDGGAVGGGAGPAEIGAAVRWHGILRSWLVGMGWVSGLPFMSLMSVAKGSDDILLLHYRYWSALGLFDSRNGLMLRQVFTSSYGMGDRYGGLTCVSLIWLSSTYKSKCDRKTT
jgi:hypothetical protein